MKNVFFTVLSILLIQIGSTAQITVPREKVLTKTGMSESASIDLFPLETGIGTVKTREVSGGNTAWMRLHFKVDSAPAANTWAIQIKDSTGRIAVVIPASSISDQDFWSDEIPGSTAIVEVITIEENDTARPLRLKIVEVLKSLTPAIPRSITIPDQRESIVNQSATIKTAGRSIARLRFRAADGGSYVCTGFLVSKDIFMTNHHCISTPGELASALADFDFDEIGAKQTGLRFKEILAKSADLDFSLLRLKKPVEADRGFLPLMAVKPAGDQELLIIEHPAGEPKQVSRLDCTVESPELSGITTALTDFGHRCDTLGGASGSPVLDFVNPQSMKVIGLHHLGFDPSSDRLVNRAVRIGLIIDEIRVQNKSVLKELGIPE